MLWPPRHEFGRKWIAILAVTLGCQPSIGEECTTGTDCAQDGSRTCDATLPNGYCTKFNCEPDSCPEEAACIGFVVAPSTALACASTSESRELRTFCMLRCSSDSDCRSGYDCLDLNEPSNPWNAALMDKNRASGKVCTVDNAAMPAVEVKNAKVEYCTASTYVDNGYYDVAVSSGGVGAIGGLAQGGADNQGGATSGGSVQ